MTGQVIGVHVSYMLELANATIIVNKIINIIMFLKELTQRTKKVVDERWINTMSL